MDPELKKVLDQIADLEGKAGELKEALEGADSKEDREKVEADIKALTDRLEELESEKAEREKEANTKAMQARIESLEKQIETARKPQAGFNFKGGVPTPEGGKVTYGEEGTHSFYADVKAAKSGDQRAWERLEESVKDAEGKAMTEGTGSAGGFLVPPQISNELIEIRSAVSVVRQLCSSINIGVDELQVAAVDSGLAVGWVAELAEKPINDLTFSSLSVNVFTAAGLAVASNQLLADSRFSIDQLVNTDLAKRLANLEAIAIYNGSGVGQPRGILQTAGVGSHALTSTDVKDLLDKITEAITDVYSLYFGPPSAIVMHPRTWGRIVKARESTSPSTYLIGAGSTAFGRRANEPLPGYGQGALPRGELFGVPVYTDACVPTNLGDDGNESCVIVGDFSQGLVLDRQGITTDQSEHVRFTSNQTVFRSEERVGFTAARYPDAFQVVQGSGLAGG